MFYSYETMLFINRILLYIVIVFFIIDCFSVLYIRKSNLQIKNKYYDLQKKYKYSFAVISKLALILILSFFLLDPPGNAGAVAGIAVVYSLIVVVLLVDIFRALRSIKADTGKAIPKTD